MDKVMNIVIVLNVFVNELQTSQVSKFCRKTHSLRQFFSFAIVEFRYFLKTKKFDLTNVWLALTRLL